MRGPESIWTTQSAVFVCEESRQPSVELFLPLINSFWQRGRPVRQAEDESRIEPVPFGRAS